MIPNDPNKIVFPELSYKIIGILVKVDNLLGYGHTEKTICKSIEALLVEEQIPFKREVPIEIVITSGKKIKYFADFILDEKIVLEIKVGLRFQKEAFKQIRSYLEGIKKELGILALFSPKGVRFKRILFSLG